MISWMRAVSAILHRTDLDVGAARRAIKQYPTNDGFRQERAGIGNG
jgi:hypothetical protein